MPREAVLAWAVYRTAMRRQAPACLLNRAISPRRCRSGRRRLCGAAEGRHESIQRHDLRLAVEVLELPRSSHAKDWYDAAWVAAASPCQPACRVDRALDVSARPVPRLRLDREAEAGRSSRDMVDVPAARPVDGMASPPSLVCQLLERAPHLRFRFGADATAGGQPQGVATRERERGGEKQERQRQPRVASVGGQEDSGCERDRCEHAARRREPQTAQLLSAGIARHHVQSFAHVAAAACTPRRAESVGGRRWEHSPRRLQRRAWPTLRLLASAAIRQGRQPGRCALFGR
jgi:hypothetical protein